MLSIIILSHNLCRMEETKSSTETVVNLLKTLSFDLKLVTKT